MCGWRSIYRKLNVICHNNFAKCAYLRLAPVSYPVVRVMVMVRVRVRVRVRETLTVHIRTSNKAIFDL